MKLRAARHVALVLATILGGGSGTQAQNSEGHCNGASFGDQIGVARVAKSHGKVNFVRGVHDNKACPSVSNACRDRPFLTAGDVVLTTERRGDFVCANFVNARAVETIGWLPAAALETVAPATIEVPVGWTGTWKRVEAEIRIKPAGPGAIAVEGSATWGSYDPDRVKRGSVRSGEISAKVKPSGDTLFFADGNAASFEQAPQDACAVRMRRIARYLMVEDNNSCGGVNVSFSGIYVRR